MRVSWLSVLGVVSVGSTCVAADGLSRRNQPGHPGKPGQPARDGRVCTVKAGGNGQDDSQNILDAVHDCNNGGRVLFENGQHYTIGKAIDLTFMNSVDLDIQGYIEFTDNTTYWQENSFQFVFQDATSFWLLGGNDVSIYGGGTINGNGQAWYNLYVQNDTTLRPTLMGVEGLYNSVISNLNLVQSPTYHYFVANSSNVVIENMNIDSTSNNESAPAANTDGIDIYRSDSMTLKDWIVNNDDDCVSLKPNSTNILIQNFHCNGSHGISVGSLGQYVGTYSIVENVLAENIVMTNAATGARIKVWPDVPSTESGDLSGGGGSGLVNNVTFENFYVENVKYAIEVDQCYGQSNLTLCYDNPSPLKIENVLFKNFYGTTTSSYAPDIAAFACSSSTACTNIQAEDINVTGPTESLAYCYNVDESLLQGINCTGPYEGFY